MKILVLGNYRQTITVVRALARAGNRIVLGMSGPLPFTRFSNCVDEIWRHSDERLIQTFHQELETYLRAEARANPVVVFPVGEVQLRALANLPVQAQALAAWAMPPPEVVRGCLDKLRSNHIAEKVGVPFPPTQIVTTKAAIIEATHRLGFPTVFKLKDSTRLLGGRKAFICWKPDDLTDLISTSEVAEGLQILAQKWIQGYRVNCHFSAYDGAVSAYFQQKVLRTTEPDGTGFSVESVSLEPQAELRSKAEAMIRAFHYTGVGCAQFMIEESTGKPWFLELNPRLDASAAMPYQQGIDFPSLAVAIATGRQAAPVPATCVAGVKLAWLHGDLLAWLHAVRVREVGLIEGFHWLRELLRSFFTIRRHLTWDWSDPLPTIYLYGVATPAAALQSLLKPQLSRSGHLDGPVYPESPQDPPGTPDRR